MRSTKKGRVKLPLPILIAVPLIVLLAAGGILGFGKLKSHGAKQPAKVDLVQWKFDDMLLTLADSGDLHYLKVSMAVELEILDPSAKGREEEKDNPDRCKMLDVTNSVISSKKLSQLIADTGRVHLKSELMANLNEKIKTVKVHEILFTYFNVQ